MQIQIQDFSVLSFKQDDILKEFAKKARRELRISAKAAGYDSGTLNRSFRARLKKNLTHFEGVSIGFARHGIFLDKGVREGVKLGSSESKPKNWIEPVLDNLLPKLADDISKVKGDDILDSISINGVNR